jgi:hypothetical protein
VGLGRLVGGDRRQCKPRLWGALRSGFMRYLLGARLLDPSEPQQQPLVKVSFSFINDPPYMRTHLFGVPPMSERIEFIDIALQERRALETALAELVAKHDRSPSPELARMIQIIEDEVIQRQRVPAILPQTEELIQKNEKATVGQAS